jgi:hypothetical protein
MQRSEMKDLAHDREVGTASERNIQFDTQIRRWRSG